MWRSYGAGGRGFAIGFSTDAIERLERFLHTEFALRPAVYDPKKQVQALDLLLSVADECAESSHVLHTAHFDGESWASLGLTVEAMGYLPSIKHPAFAGEREWRLIATRYEEAEVRTRRRTAGGSLIPYIELLLVELLDSHGDIGTNPHMPIREIVMGPLNGRRESDELRRLLAEHQRGANVRLRKSAVPLRY
jgi:hypothetical protein